MALPLLSTARKALRLPLNLTNLPASQEHEQSGTSQEGATDKDLTRHELVDAVSALDELKRNGFSKSGRNHQSKANGTEDGTALGKTDGFCQDGVHGCPETTASCTGGQGKDYQPCVRAGKDPEGEAEDGARGAAEEGEVDAAEAVA